MANHGLKVSRLDSGRIQLMSDDGASIEVARAEVLELMTDMVMAFIPPDVLEIAMEVYDNDRNGAAYSFIAPARGLGGATPLSMCGTDEGRAAVVTFYNRVSHGIYF